MKLANWKESTKERPFLGLWPLKCKRCRIRIEIQWRLLITGIGLLAGKEVPMQQDHSLTRVTCYGSYTKAYTKVTWILSCVNLYSCSNSH